MENLYNRHEIADKVYFTSITDDKFKINRVSVIFITQLSKNAAVNALLPRLLTKCSAKLDTMTKLNKKLAELYSASLNWNVWVDGDYQLFDMSIIVLNNRYSLNGEDILGESVNILLDCLFDPLLENGAFPIQSLELEKQNLMDDNDAEINNKTQYAYLKAYEEAFRGEPAEIRWGGKNDEVKAITAETAMEAYRRMLSEMRIEIICAGESDFDGLDKIFADAFGRIDRKPEKLIGSRISEAKPEPVRFTESLSIEQSKLVIFHKTPYRRRYPLMVMQALYGGPESSKLFQNVREKMSLCYYCFSRCGYSKGFISTECGVDEKNLARTEQECLNQLKELTEGRFSDDELNKIKLHIINTIRLSQDTVSGIASRCLSSILYPEIACSVEESIDQINAVSREEIIEAARTLVPDTVFILRSEKEAAE